MLDKLDELGIADDTIVLYSTDNGPHMNSWPDGAMTPFRGEKNTNWEGAFRVPQLIRWPGQDRRGRGLQRDHQPSRLAPTLLRGGRARHQGEAARRATRLDGTSFKVHLDGYDFLRTSPARPTTSPRTSSSTSPTTATSCVRYDNWKLVFMEQRVAGTLQVWVEPFVAAAGPEDLQPAHRPVRARRRHLEHLLGLVPRPHFLVVPAQGIVGGVPADVPGVPAAPEAASFTIDQVQAKIEAAIASGH